MNGHVASPESEQSFSRSVTLLFGYLVVASKERLDSSDNILVVVYPRSNAICRSFVNECEGVSATMSRGKKQSLVVAEQRRTLRPMEAWPNIGVNTREREESGSWLPAAAIVAQSVIKLRARRSSTRCVIARIVGAMPVRPWLAGQCTHKTWSK
jgi:hypothetical protein